MTLMIPEQLFAQVDYPQHPYVLTLSSQRQSFANAYSGMMYAKQHMYRTGNETDIDGRLSMLNEMWMGTKRYRIDPMGGVGSNMIRATKCICDLCEAFWDILCVDTIGVESMRGTMGAIDNDALGSLIMTLFDDLEMDISGSVFILHQDELDVPVHLHRIHPMTDGSIYDAVVRRNSNIPINDPGAPAAHLREDA